MKLSNPTNFSIVFLLLFCINGNTTLAQDAAISPTVMGIRYILTENKIPYLLVTTKRKVGRKFEPVKGISISIYFNDATSNNLLGKIITSSNGEGKAAFPASFKATWDSATQFKFLAISNAPKGQEPLSSDISIKKAILTIDTILVDGVKTVTAQLKEKIGNDWVAVKDIEMKLGIKRMLGNLTVGDAETYTADSSGVASAEFKRESMPGDEKGNIILVAKIEDNDSYGNLTIEKLVPWGKAVLVENNFWHRTLWSTGNRAPVWLLIIALSIIIGVWTVLIYLIKQILVIKKMGKIFDQNTGNLKSN